MYSKITVILFMNVFKNVFKNVFNFEKFHSQKSVKIKFFKSNI